MTSMNTSTASRRTARETPLNKNPFAPQVPCHRVIGSNGDLVGYGGDLWRKKWLLDHEAKIAHGQRAAAGFPALVDERHETSLRRRPDKSNGG